MSLLRRFYERYGELLGPMALRSFDELEAAVRRNGFLTKYLDRVLPLPRPDRLVARLLVSPAALAEAAEGILDPDEQRLLLRGRPRRTADLCWSEHDLPLLDEARTLVDGPPRAYGHVIVDEAQDLTPMQLLSISRRAVDGSLTILGDVAQATGPVVYDRWEELEVYLPEAFDVSIEELRHAYRVPAEIMDVALPLLERIAPGVEPPVAYRQGGAPPRFVEAPPGAVLEAALTEAAAMADLDGLLAVIAPRSLALEGAAGAFDETAVPVVTPRQAKGLEFDHVVVVEPALIVEEGRDSGLRELYVALTRPTKTLVVVHARPLPAPLG
jgi:DNA helicase IV